MNEIPNYEYSAEEPEDEEAPDQVQYTGVPEAFEELLGKMEWTDHECELNGPPPKAKQLRDAPGFWWRRRWSIQRLRIGDFITASGACLKHGNPWPSRAGGPHLPCVECGRQRRLRVPVPSRKLKAMMLPKDKIVEVPKSWVDIVEVEASNVAYLFDDGTTEGTFLVWRVVQIVRAA